LAISAVRGLPASSAASDADIGASVEFMAAAAK